MMITVPNVQPESISLSEDLHAALEQAERQILHLDKSSIQQFLVQMDKIEQMWTQNVDHGSLHGETVRWQRLLKVITTHPELITRAAVQAGGLSKLGPLFPPATGLWWHADLLLAELRNQIWRRTALLSGTVVVVLWIINKFVSHRAASTGAASSLVS